MQALCSSCRFLQNALQALGLPGQEGSGAALFNMQMTEAASLEAGLRLTYVCYLFNDDRGLCRAGLAPEKITFLEEGGTRVDAADAGNVLRPETVESLYYMWRLTGEQRYQEWGWSIFQAFQEHAKGDVGYHSLLVHSGFWSLSIGMMHAWALWAAQGPQGSQAQPPPPAQAYEGRGEW